MMYIEIYLEYYRILGQKLSTQWWGFTTFAWEAIQAVKEKTRKDGSIRWSLSEWVSGESWKHLFI